MLVILLNNQPIQPYVGCPDLIVGDIYRVEKSKTNHLGDLVYMIEDSDGCWKLASRFIKWDIKEEKEISLLEKVNLKCETLVSDY